VVVDAPDGRIPFATTQLTSAPGDSASRGVQVKELAGLLAAHSAHDDPVVLTGDLNAEPDSDEVRLLCGHKTPPARPGFVLVNAWRYADADAIPWTWTGEPHVAATMEPRARIAYVLSERRTMAVSRFMLGTGALACPPAPDPRSRI
jgi:endonuclease/exonuclease/phosphatase family metal-dependent hydrolase